MSTNKRLMPYLTELENPQRIQNTLLPYGALYMISFLSKTFGRFNVSTPNLTISTDGPIRLISRDRHFETKM